MNLRHSPSEGPLRLPNCCLYICLFCDVIYNKCLQNDSWSAKDSFSLLIELFWSVIPQYITPSLMNDLCLEEGKGTLYLHLYEQQQEHLSPWMSHQTSYRFKAIFRLVLRVAPAVFLTGTPDHNSARLLLVKDPELPNIYTHLQDAQLSIISKQQARRFGYWLILYYFQGALPSSRKK